MLSRPLIAISRLPTGGSKKLTNYRCVRFVAGSGDHYTREQPEGCLPRLANL